MRRGRGTTDAASGQVLSAGVSLSPAGAAGASLVVTERARDAGGVVCVPSRPASAVDWLRCFDEQRGRGGRSRSLQNATITPTVSPTETEAGT